MLQEDEVYIGAKAFLVGNGWTLLGGQPPSGCNHLPVIEIKDPNRVGIGSKGAYKPDLVAHMNGITLVVECKPDFSRPDEAKLLGILSDPGKKRELYDEMSKRNLFERHGIHIGQGEFERNLRGALAHSGSTHSHRSLLVLSIENMEGRGLAFCPADDPIFKGLFRHR